MSEHVPPQLRRPLFRSSVPGLRFRNKTTVPSALYAMKSMGLFCVGMVGTSMSLFQIGGPGPAGNSAARDLEQAAEN